MIFLPSSEVSFLKFHFIFFNYEVIRVQEMTKSGEEAHGKSQGFAL